MPVSSVYGDYDPHSHGHGDHESPSQGQGSLPTVALLVHGDCDSHGHSAPISSRCSPTVKPSTHPGYESSIHGHGDHGCCCHGGSHFTVTVIFHRESSGPSSLTPSAALGAPPGGFPAAHDLTSNTAVSPTRVSSLQAIQQLAKSSTLRRQQNPPFQSVGTSQVPKSKKTDSKRAKPFKTVSRPPPSPP